MALFDPLEGDGVTTAGGAAYEFDGDEGRRRGFLAEVKAYEEASGGAAGGELFGGVAACGAGGGVEVIEVKDGLTGEAEVAMIFAAKEGDEAAYVADELYLALPIPAANRIRASWTFTAARAFIDWLFT